MACSCHADDSRLAETAMSRFEGITHDIHVACAIIREVDSPNLMIAKPLTCGPDKRVVAMCGAKFLSYLMFSLVDIESIDTCGTAQLGCLDYC